LRRRTLILGLSDGARLDILRHSTVGVLSNEQFVIQTQLDKYKWTSLVEDLKTEQADTAAAFEVAFLVDDFMGTGSSYLRYDNAKAKWTGKLCKFLQSLKDAETAGVKVMAKDWQLCIHHFLATHNEVPLARDSNYTFGAKVAAEYRIGSHGTGDEALIALTQKYYSTKIQTKHTEVGGVKHIGLGYGGCALPLVLHHNTPNNSLALLWADSPAGPDKLGLMQPEMRPLFRRRQRHTES